MPKKIKVGSTAWIKKMAKARKAAAKERKKGGGKKKLLTRKNLEARVKALEDQLSGKTRMEQGIGETLGERDRTRKKLDAGDW